MTNSLAIARELQAMAQTGLHFAGDPYDQQRYERLAEIASDLLAEHSTLEPKEIYDWNRQEFGYATPKVDVRAFILRESKVLLIREDADGGRWTLPGGWADVNESASKSVVREVEEECGYVVKAIRLLAVLDREEQGHPPPFPYHVYKMFFHCEIVGGEPRRTLESSESAFFDRRGLPELSTSRVLPGQIEAFFEMMERDDVRADFD